MTFLCSGSSDCILDLIGSFCSTCHCWLKEFALLELFFCIFLELDDGAYNPLWTMRGFTQTFHFWKETRRAQSVPLNAFLTYITLPWWSIAKGMFCTVKSVSNWNLHWMEMIYLSEHSLVAGLWWEVCTSRMSLQTSTACCWGNKRRKIHLKK